MWRAVVALSLAACGRFDFDPRADVDAPPAPDAPTGTRGPGTWTALPAPPLSPRVWTSAIWTGASFVVYGGALDAGYTPSADIVAFDPGAQRWRTLSTAGGPGARHTTKMAMIDGQLLEYGGGSGFGAVAGGGIYDPAGDTWRSTGATPGARIYAHTVAVGRKLFVWGGWDGGQHLKTGFLFDLDTLGWTPISTTNAPSERSFASVVSTGDKIIVWGGCQGGMPSCATVFGDGAVYDPATDRWAPIATAGAPTPRSQSAAVWSGKEMIVFGGAGAGDEGMKTNTGGAYDPATDTWRPIATTGAPNARVDPGAVWLGDKMFLWGDDVGKTDGFLYDPTADAWTQIAQSNAPTSRARFAFAASDHQVFVWGGSFDEITGAVWTPEP